jgi:deaminated glutathione amidase
MIVDPWGKVLAQVPDRPGFATARIDLAYVERVREMLPVHRHRVLPG